MCLQPTLVLCEVSARLSSFAAQNGLTPLRPASSRRSLILALSHSSWSSNSLSFIPDHELFLLSPQAKSEQDYYANIKVDKMLTHEVRLKLSKYFLTSWCPLTSPKRMSDPSWALALVLIILELGLAVSSM